MIAREILEWIRIDEAITGAETGNVFGSEDLELERLRDLVTDIKAACQQEEQRANQELTLPSSEVERLRKIEEAARIAFVHLSWLDGHGALTCEEEPMMEALREALTTKKYEA